MKHKFVFCLLIFLISKIGIAQDQSIVVSGKVFSEDGGHLSNVTIRSKYSNIETFTTENGEFNLLLPDKDSLVFSFLGYRSKSIEIEASQTFLEVVLFKLENVIEEIQINTGYQELSLNEINGSVVSIDKHMLSLQVDPNILNRLNGVINGMMFQRGRENTNPQNETGITIRGYGTINGPLDPLIVLDDFVYEGSIDNIDPNDIESVTVLKDAEATSIYGARGGNGVIVLTTKKGRFGQDLSVSTNVNVSISKIPDLNVLPWISNSDYIKVEEMLYETGYFDEDINSFRAPPITPIVRALLERSDGRLTDKDYQLYKEFLSKGDFRKQYSRAFLKPSRNEQYYVGLSGGSQNSSWSFSVGQNRIHENTGSIIKKQSLRANNTLRFGKRLEINLNGLYTHQHNNSSDIPSYQSLTRVGDRQLVPYMNLYDNEGNEVPFDMNYNSSLLDTLGGGKLKDWRYYPLAESQYTDFDTKGSEVLGTIAVNLNLIEGVRLKSHYQLQSQNTFGNRHHAVESFYARDLINRFSVINEETGEIEYNVPNGDILFKSVSKQTSQSFRSLLDVEQRFAGIHHLRGFIGVEAREVRSDANSSTYYGYKKDPLEYLQVNQIGVFSTLPLGSTASIGGGPQMDPTLINRFVSVFGNIHYLLSNRYSISGSMRKDGSNIYGVSTNDKWKPLWSVGFGYEISNEPFFKALPFSQFKFKGTWGYSGNVDLSRSALPVAVYGNNAVNVGGLPYARIGTINNPSLRWEEVRQFNIGADFSLRNIPLDGSIEFYTKAGSDLYGPSDYDYTTWGTLGTIVRNIAKMEGKGIDMQWRYTLNRGGLRWRVGLIYNYNMNKTQKYYDESTFSSLYRLVSSNGTQITPLEGYPLYALAGFVWKGLDDKGNPMGLLDGKITTDYSTLINGAMDKEGSMESMRFLGSAIPVHFGSILQEFSYKNLNVSFNILYKFGYYFQKSSLSYSGIVNQGMGHADFEKRWQKPGDITDIPSFEYPLITPDRDNFYGGSEIHILKGDHIRLQFVNFSYAFPINNPKQIFQNISATLNFSNLGILWRANHLGIDPDYPEIISPSRQTSIGIKVNF